MARATLGSAVGDRPYASGMRSITSPFDGSITTLSSSGPYHELPSTPDQATRYESCPE